MINKHLTQNCSILFTTKEDGNFNSADKMIAFLEPKFPHHQLGVLDTPLPHGSSRVHWHQTVERKTGDAVITDNPNIVLAMSVGDCFPVVLYEPQKQVVALIHGGWRSLLQNIIQLTFKELKYFDYRCDPQKILAWIGPGIQKDSNTSLEPPVQSLFGEWEPYVSQKEQTYHVDLARYIKDQLILCHVLPAHVTDSHRDTYQESAHFYSHRRAKLTDDVDGRHIVAAWINHSKH